MQHKMSYLIVIPERITLSPRAYMQFHNHDRQLISLCEIQKCHAAKNVMRPKMSCGQTPTTHTSD